MNCKTRLCWHIRRPGAGFHRSRGNMVMRLHVRDPLADQVLLPLYRETQTALPPLYLCSATSRPLRHVRHTTPHHTTPGCAAPSTPHVLYLGKRTMLLEHSQGYLSCLGFLPSILIAAPAIWNILLTASATLYPVVSALQYGEVSLILVTCFHPNYLSVKVYNSYVLSLLHWAESQIEVQSLHNSFSDKWDQFEEIVMFLSDCVSAGGAGLNNRASKAGFWLTMREASSAGQSSSASKAGIWLESCKTRSAGQKSWCSKAEL